MKKYIAVVLVWIQILLNISIANWTYIVDVWYTRKDVYLKWYSNKYKEDYKNYLGTYKIYFKDEFTKNDTSWSNISNSINASFGNFDDYYEKNGRFESLDKVQKWMLLILNFHINWMKKYSVNEDSFNLLKSKINEEMFNIK